MRSWLVRRFCRRLSRSVWPNFYYGPDITGKNAWLLSQAFFFAIYFAGMVLAFATVRRALNAVAAGTQ